MTCNSALHVNLFPTRYASTLTEFVEVVPCLERDITVRIEQCSGETL